MGLQRPLRAGILLRALLNGMVDVNPQDNNRMAESLKMFVAHPIIQSPSDFTRGNLESILRDCYVQPGLGTCDLHQQDVYSQPSE